jgi:hypothetical protein
MSIPDGADCPRYLELIISLPDYWRLDQESFSDEKWYWPVRLIKGLARLPSKYNTWLAWGHTVPNGNPAVPYADNTKLCGAAIVLGPSTPDIFRKLKINERKEISFLSVMPLYEEEMNLKLRLGIEELLKRFDDASINDVVDPVRRNVAKKRFGSWFSK